MKHPCLPVKPPLKGGGLLRAPSALRLPGSPYLGSSGRTRFLCVCECVPSLARETLLKEIVGCLHEVEIVPSCVFMCWVQDPVPAALDGHCFPWASPADSETTVGAIHRHVTATLMLSHRLRVIHARGLAASVGQASIMAQLGADRDCLTSFSPVSVLFLEKCGFRKHPSRQFLSDIAPLIPDHPQYRKGFVSLQPQAMTDHLPAFSKKEGQWEAALALTPPLTPSPPAGCPAPGMHIPRLRLGLSPLCPPMQESVAGVPVAVTVTLHPPAS